MNTVILKSDGELQRDGVSVPADPLRYLGYKVELGQGYTLRSFFRMIERYPVFAQLNAFFPECMQLYQACPDGECLAPGMGQLELYKTVEMMGFPGEPRL
ncbi:MAG: hypothetical protein MUC57_19180 [Desulfobacterales bacterium]|nr:hypothetical protein [Desulfobacterales bacterium]